MVNTIKSIDSIISISGRDWNYETIISFLDILCLLEKCLPDSMSHTAIFDDYLALITRLKVGVLPQIYHFLLVKVRILKTLGILNPKEMHSLPIGRYILNNIREKSVHELLGSKHIDDETLFGIRRTIDLSTQVLI